MWKSTFLHAALVSYLAIGLFYYWFVVADRYKIFLYNHLNATPFDEITQSRYWMAGLVASGIVMVLYIFGNWLWGRIRGMFYKRYEPPVWWKVWLVCFVPLVVGIPAITMNFNHPALPFFNAVQCVFATLLGLALALIPGALAAQQPLKVGMYTLTGLGLVPGFLLLRAIELPATGLISASFGYSIAVGSTLAGIVWLITVVWLQSRWLQWQLKPLGIFSAGCCISYLFLPLIHYMFFTPPEFKYISTAANFFALNYTTQILCWIIAAVCAIGAGGLSRKWIEQIESR